MFMLKAEDLISLSFYLMLKAEDFSIRQSVFKINNMLKADN